MASHSLIKRIVRNAVALFTFGLAVSLAPLAHAQPVRPNILIVFDTSTSMLQANADGSMLCNGAGTGSRLYRLKQALRDTLIEIGTDEVNFGLARFAQRETPATDRGCFRGHYINSLDTGPGAGCKTSAVTEDTDGAFFAPSIASEVVVVPVTSRLEAMAAADYDPAGANVRSIFKWLDNKEAVDPGMTMLTDPEIRSGGSKTPLAATLRYSRFYFDKYVRPKDPKAKCRRNIVLLVTDGAETCESDGAAQASAKALFDGKTDVYVVAGPCDETAGTAAEQAQCKKDKASLDLLAKAGSGGQRSAIFVDFTKPDETKKALVGVIADAVPKTEICNGFDDNCNDQIDEGNLPEVGEACVCGGVVSADQIGRGICKASVKKCAAGKIVCEGCVGPQMEVCNGIDDNCNGLVDEDVDKQKPEPCACDGGANLMTLMQPMTMCRAGRNSCRDAKWVCDGCRQPVKETCDCEDNDCNGKIDDGAECGMGFACVGCKCQQICSGVEFDCGNGFICDKTTMPNICKSGKCTDKICAVGTTCDPADGQCKANCNAELCPSPKYCRNDGKCVDCYAPGENCPANEICTAVPFDAVKDSGDGARSTRMAGKCLPNPCAGKSCGRSKFCNAAGQCEPICEPPCDSGQTCKLGVCEADPCAEISCDLGKLCDPKTKACTEDKCARGNGCNSDFQVCVPATGACAEKLCDTVVKCGNCYACDYAFDGKPYCKVNPACQPEYVEVTAEGSGCKCDLGGRREGSSGSGLSSLFALLGALVLGVGRRRRRS